MTIAALACIPLIFASSSSLSLMSAAGLGSSPFGPWLRTLFCSSDRAAWGSAAWAVPRPARRPKAAVAQSKRRLMVILGSPDRAVVAPRTAEGRPGGPHRAGGGRGASGGPPGGHLGGGALRKSGLRAAPASGSGQASSSAVIQPP